MSSEQYRAGSVTVTNASQVVIGDGTDWLDEISLPAVFKADLDGESTYSVGSVLTATRMLLAANYVGSTNSGLSYMMCRSFTANRGYWRPQQGDYDWAEILSQETIDKIDTDIANLQSGIVTTETKTDDYDVQTADAGKSLRMNSTRSRRFNMPEVGSASNGIRVTLAKINAGKLSAFGAPGFRVRNSSPSGSVYCNVATQLHANITLEYVHEARRWIDVGHDGTWVTQSPSTDSCSLDSLIKKDDNTQTTGLDAHVGTYEELGLDAILI